MLQQAFDQYAPIYDQDFTHTAIGRLQRKRVYQFLHPFLSKPLNILELNCGTGEDVMHFLQKGHTVTAMDIAPSMIEAVRKKIKDQTPELYACSIQEIKSLNLSPNYDLVFSNFGGLNCLPLQDLEKCSKDLYELTRKDAHLFFTIMGRKCLLEKWYFRMKGKKEQASRRLSAEGIVTEIQGDRFFTYYYSPGEIKKLFSNYFELCYARPVGLFIPPSYLNPFFKNKKWLLSLLNTQERFFGRFAFLSDYADHYVIVLKRKNT